VGLEEGAGPGTRTRRRIGSDGRHKNNQRRPKAVPRGPAETYYSVNTSTKSSNKKASLNLIRAKKARNLQNLDAEGQPTFNKQRRSLEGRKNGHNSALGPTIRRSEGLIGKLTIQTEELKPSAFLGGAFSHREGCPDRTGEAQKGGKKKGQRSSVHLEDGRETGKRGFFHRDATESKDRGSEG